MLETKIEKPKKHKQVASNLKEKPKLFNAKKHLGHLKHVFKADEIQIQTKLRNEW